MEKSRFSLILENALQQKLGYSPRYMVYTMDVDRINKYLFYYRVSKKAIFMIIW